MPIRKLSISLPFKQYQFIKDYQILHHYKTSSKVIQQALRLLQQTQLEACYEEANAEIDHDFDITCSDGVL